MRLQSWNAGREARVQVAGRGQDSGIEDLWTRVWDVSHVICTPQSNPTYVGAIGLFPRKPLLPGLSSWSIVARSITPLPYTHQQHEQTRITMSLIWANQPGSFRLYVHDFGLTSPTTYSVVNESLRVSCFMPQPNPSLSAARSTH